MDFLNRKAIKAEARAFIRPDKKWFYMFLAWLPILAVNGIFNIRFNYNFGEDVSWQEMLAQSSRTSALSFVGSIVSLLLIPFNIALVGYFLNHIRGFNPEWKSLYVEGKDRFGKYFEVGFITGLVVFLWSLLFIIPGIVKAYAYSQVNYIIHDNPNLSTQDARKISDLMTKGYKGELFVKDLSFFWWYLFVGVTIGLGAMYVGPYHHVTNAMYYENLKNHAIEAGLVAPEAFGIINTPVENPEAQGFDAPEQNQFSGTATFYTPNQPVNNGYQVPQGNTYQPPVNNAYQAPVNNGFEPAAPVAPAQINPEETFTAPDESASFIPDDNMTKVVPPAAQEQRPAILNGEEYIPENKPFDGE